MKAITKRILSLILAMAMALSLLVSGAWAAEADTSDASEAPAQVSAAAETDEPESDETSEPGAENGESSDAGADASNSESSPESEEDGAASAEVAEPGDAQDEDPGALTAQDGENTEVDNSWRRPEDADEMYLWMVQQIEAFEQKDSEELSKYDLNDLTANNVRDYYDELRAYIKAHAKEMPQMPDTQFVMRGKILEGHMDDYYKFVYTPQNDRTIRLTIYPIDQEVDRSRIIETISTDELLYSFIPTSMLKRQEDAQKHTHDDEQSYYESYKLRFWEGTVLDFYRLCFIPKVVDLEYAEGITSLTLQNEAPYDSFAEPSAQYCAGYRGETGLRSIKFPKSLKNIGAYYFSDFYNLIQVSKAIFAKSRF